MNNFWCSVNKNHQVSNNMHPPFMNSTFIFLGIYTSIITPCLATAKILVYPPNPSQWVKKMEESAIKFSIGLPGFKGYRYFFQNPKLLNFWDFIPFVHSHLLLFRRISPWPIKKQKFCRGMLCFTLESNLKKRRLSFLCNSH